MKDLYKKELFTWAGLKFFKKKNSTIMLCKSLRNIFNRREEITQEHNSHIKTNPGGSC